jgi:hypothetical protein
MTRGPFKHDKKTTWKGRLCPVHLPTFPRTGTWSVTTTATRAQHLIFPRRVHSLDSPRHRGLHLAGVLTRTHQIVSFKTNKTTSHLDGLTRAHAYPSVLLKNARGNDTAVERPPGQSLATHGGSGVSAFWPSEWSKLKAQGLLTHPAVTQKTPHLIKALEGVPHPSKASGATPGV